MRIGGEAPSGGPILSVGISAMFVLRFPPPRILSSAAREKPARAPNGVEWYARSVSPFSPLDVRRRLQCLARRDQAPERDEQLACQRDDHRLARANTAISSSGAVPQCQCALLLKPQKAPGELDHTAADPGVACPLFSPGAGLASPCSRRFAPLSSGEPVRPA